MHVHGWSGTLGILSGCMLLVAAAVPVFGEDGSGKNVERTSQTETPTIQAHPLSDAEMDEITAGFNLLPPDPIHLPKTGIQGLGSTAADEALGAALGVGGGPHEPVTQFDGDTLLPAVQLPAVQQ